MSVALGYALYITLLFDYLIIKCNVRAQDLWVYHI